LTLDAIQPRGIGRGEVEAHPVFLCPFHDFLLHVRLVVVQHDMRLKVLGNVLVDLT